MNTRIPTILIAMLFASNLLSAQQINISEQDVVIDKASCAAWSLEITEDPAEVQKEFIKYMKGLADVSPNKKNKTSFIYTEMIVPGVSDKSGDLKGIIHNNNGINFLSVSFFFGNDLYINSEDFPEEMRGLKSLVINFILAYKTERYEALIAQKSDRLSSLNDKLTRSGKSVATLEKQIEKTNKSLMKASEEEEDDKTFDLNNKLLELEGDLKTEKELIANTKIEVEKLSTEIQVAKDELTLLKMEEIELREEE